MTNVEVHRVQRMPPVDSLLDPRPAEVIHAAVKVWFIHYHLQTSEYFFCCLVFFFTVFECPLYTWKSRGMGIFGISAPQGQGFLPEGLAARDPAAWDSAWHAGEAW